MPIDKDKQVSASVILDKEIYEKVKDIAKSNKRSVSSQLAIVIEDFVKQNEKIQS